MKKLSWKTGFSVPGEDAKNRSVSITESQIGVFTCHHLGCKIPTIVAFSKLLMYISKKTVH